MSDVTTPATVSYTTAALRTTRLAPARVTYRVSSFTSTKDTASSLSASTVELDRLTSYDQLLNPDGTPSIRFMSIWQKAMGQIETALAGLVSQVSDNSAILARLTAAEALAEVANDNAVAAQAAATTTSTAVADTFSQIDAAYAAYYDSLNPLG